MLGLEDKVLPIVVIDLYVLNNCEVRARLCNLKQQQEPSKKDRCL